MLTKFQILFAMIYSGCKKYSFCVKCRIIIFFKQTWYIFLFSKVCRTTISNEQTEKYSYCLYKYQKKKKKNEQKWTVFIKSCFNTLHNQQIVQLIVFQKSKKQHEKSRCQHGNETKFKKQGCNIDPNVWCRRSEIASSLSVAQPPVIALTSFRFPRGDVTKSSGADRELITRKLRRY